MCCFRPVRRISQTPQLNLPRLIAIHTAELQSGPFFGNVFPTLSLVGFARGLDLIVIEASSSTTSNCNASQSSMTFAKRSTQNEYITCTLAQETSETNHKIQMGGLQPQSRTATKVWQGLLNKMAGNDQLSN